MDSIRPAVQSVVKQLPTEVHTWGSSLVGPYCYNKVVLGVDFSDVDCLKLGISKGLGIGIIAASAVVKVPQILKLIRSKSADGVSFLSYLLETSAYIISLAYNFRNGFPFSTYGETALIVGQNIIISVLVLNYSGKAGLAAVFIATLAASAAGLFSENVVDGQTLSYLQAGAGILGVASKVPQIAAIWQQGGTGQLSAFAVFNYLAGSLSRIFTTLQEVDDKLILYGFISGFVLNLILALQMIYYWNAPATTASKKTKAKRKNASGKAAGSAASTPSGKSTGSSTPKKGPTTRRRG